jgi:hypothetical protein
VRDYKISPFVDEMYIKSLQKNNKAAVVK